MNLLDLSKMYNLSNTENQIVDRIIYLLQNQEKITIRKVAKQTYVSTTTIVNLAKKLGFNSYSEMMHEMKRSFKSDNRGTKIELYDELFSNITEEDVDSFISQLNKYKDKRIFLLGIGYSAIGTTYFNKKLSASGFAVYEGSPLDMINEKIDKSLVIVISRSGETNDLIHIMNRMKSYDYETVLFTANKNSTLGTMVDLVFEIYDGNLTPFTIAPDYFLGKILILFEFLISKYLVG